ncbi:MAG: hypothetical protein IKQ36_10465 [Clostridia bacterium]|nr:hypothetical protein [Clostridia bacterium]
MKKRWLAAVAIFLLAAVALIGGCNLQNDPDNIIDIEKFRLDPNEIASLIFGFSYNGYSSGDVDKLYAPFTTEDSGEIKAFTDCLAAVEKNNRNADHDIMLAPHEYNITIVFKDGETITYIYKVFCEKSSTEIKDPFDAFFLLPSIQEKMEPERAEYR